MNNVGLDHVTIPFATESSINAVSEQEVKIWYCLWHERFNSLNFQFLKYMKGVVLVFDVTNEESFKSLSVYMEKICEHAGVDIPIVLVGNKVDLVEDRKVSI